MMTELNIIEIGPGRGALCDSILDFFKNYNLKMYRTINYKLIEISPVLSKACEDLLAQNHSNLWK